jgi:hypothetical protein
LVQFLQKTTFNGGINNMTVSGFAACKRCGGLGEYFLYGRGEYQYLCFFCGYYGDAEIVSEGRTGPKLKKKLVHSAGAIRILDKTGHGWTGHRPSIEKADEKKEIADFKEAMAQPDADLKGSYLTRWDPVKKEITYLFGNPEEAWKEQLKTFAEILREKDEAKKE